MLKMFGKSRFVLSSVITLCQAQITMFQTALGLNPELHGSPQVGWSVPNPGVGMEGGSGVRMSKESFQEEVVDDL